MSGGTTDPNCVQDLLEGFRKYDRAVDIVSAFEMLFVSSRTELPATVAHFERFPILAHPDGNRATPDMSVVFNDGRGLVGEIANLSLQEGSVDSLCKQVGRYDSLEGLPGTTELVPVDRTDVAILVPLEVGLDAVRRVHYDRRLAAGHPYNPSQAPVLIQFGFDSGKYSFQRLPDPENGQFNDDGRPEEARLSHWFERTVSVKPARFSEIKATRAFMNDPVNDLYLATHLWAKTFATRAGRIGGGFPRRLEADPEELAASLRADHGGVRAQDVVRALELLQRAGLTRIIEGRWVVAWDALGGATKDLPRTLAERACRKSKSGTIAKLLKKERSGAVAERVPTLFDSI